MISQKWDILAYIVFALLFICYIVIWIVEGDTPRGSPVATAFGGAIVTIVLINTLLKLIDFLKSRQKKLKDMLPEIVLLIGAVLFALRLFFPPKRFPYSTTDFHTGMLHALGIAVITIVAYYFLKRWKSQ